MQSFGVVFLIAGFVALVAGLWVYYERRDRVWSEKPRRRSLHFCVKCQDVYPSVPSQPVAECPKCARANPRLQY